MKTLLLFAALCVSCSYGFVDRRPAHLGHPIQILPRYPTINPTFPKNGGQWPDAYKRFARSTAEEQQFTVAESSQLNFEPEMSSALVQDEEFPFARVARQTFNPHGHIRPIPKPRPMFNRRFRRSALGLDEEMPFAPEQFEAQEDQMRIARQTFNPHGHVRPIPKPRPITRHRF